MFCIWPPHEEVQACVRIRSKVGLRPASPGRLKCQTGRYSPCRADPRPGLQAANINLFTLLLLCLVSSVSLTLKSSHQTSRSPPEQLKVSGDSFNLTVYSLQKLTHSLTLNSFFHLISWNFSSGPDLIFNSITGSVHLSLFRTWTHLYVVSKSQIWMIQYGSGFTPPAGPSLGRWFTFLYGLC